jgi:hypothetical protein
MTNSSRTYRVDSGCGKEDRSDPPNGLIEQQSKDKMKVRGRHSDQWWHLKGREEADYEEGCLR